MLAQHLAAFEHIDRLMAETIAERTGSDAERDLAPGLLAVRGRVALRTSIALWAERTRRRAARPRPGNPRRNCAPAFRRCHPGHRLTAPPSAAVHRHVAGGPTPSHTPRKGDLHGYVPLPARPVRVPPAMAGRRRLAGGPARPRSSAPPPCPARPPTRSASPARRRSRRSTCSASGSRRPPPDGATARVVFAAPDGQKLTDAGQPGGGRGGGRRAEAGAAGGLGDATRSPTGAVNQAGTVGYAQVTYRVPRPS